MAQSRLPPREEEKESAQYAALKAIRLITSFFIRKTTQMLKKLLDPARASKINAVHQPPRNVGEIEYENQKSNIKNDSDDEVDDSESGDDHFFGDLDE